MVKKVTATSIQKQPGRPKKSTKATASGGSKVKRTTRATPAVSTKVDYYPNRMTLAVSVLAGTIFVLVTVIALLGAHE